MVSLAGTGMGEFASWGMWLLVLYRARSSTGARRGYCVVGFWKMSLQLILEVGCAEERIGAKVWK
jgi:hypothetical protein